MRASSDSTSSNKLAQAYQYCLSTARQHYENFPTASRLIKKEFRPAVAAIYAFARHADDLADEGAAPARTRLKQIDAWETLLDRCLHEQLDQPVFLALGDSIRRFNLPVEALHNLLIAFRMDVSLHAYATDDELMFYCSHSANPVGRLMLALHGIDQAEALRASDDICSALQLINFWQDLSIDLSRGRCYIPDSILQTHDLSAQQLLDWGKDDELTKDSNNQAIQPVIKQIISTTAERLRRGYELLPWLPFRLRLQISATLHGAERMLNKIEKLQSPLSERAKLNRKDWWQLSAPILKDALMPGRTLQTQTV